MNKYSFFLLFLFGFFACVNNADRNKSVGGHSAPPPAETPAINGQKIFKVSCAICHGVDGKLGANGSKDLTKSVLTLEERISMITNGKNNMPAQKDILSAEQIKAVAEYSMTLK